MNIEMQLLQEELGRIVINHIKELDIDINNIVQTKALEVLRKIQDIVCDDNLSDFDAMEKIVCIFEEYGLDAGVRHDF